MAMAGEQRCDIEGENEPLLAARTACPQGGEERQGRSPSTALVLLFLFSTGANWTEACLGPLKSALVEDLGIDNTQYGVLSASTQLANTLLPIFTGLWIDRVGPSRMSVFATSTVCLGALMAAMACSAASYPLLVLGRIVQGMGVIIVDTAATKLLVQWARGAGGLGMAISCNFALDRAASALSKATAVPIAESGGGAKATFWVAAAVSSLSLLASTLFARFEQSVWPAPSPSRNATTAANLSSLALLKKTMTSLPALFVYISITQFYQPIAVFNNLSADVLQRKGSSQRLAGYLSSIGQVTPIFVAPLLGRFFDRHGHRMEFVPLTAVLLAVSMGLLAWTKGGDLLAMLVFSLGNALNTPPYLCSLALLLHDDGTFGCSWGVWKSLMQSYQIIMNTTLGRLQDRTPGRDYHRVLFVLFLSKIIEVGWGLSYVVLDRAYALGILAAKDSKHQSIEAIQHRPPSLHRRRDRLRSSGLRPNWYSTCLACLHLSLTVIIAWILFFTYYLSS